MVRNRPPPRRARTSVKTPAYHAVSCRRRRASGCISEPSRAEAVARAAQRRDELRLEAIVDLAAQSRHEDLEDVDERIVVVVPHVRRDRGAVEQASLVQHEQLEQGELLRGEGDLAAAAAYLARSEEHTSELQSHHDLVCRLLLEKKKKKKNIINSNNTKL